MNKKRTTNAFLFMWDMYGIESIIPISKYEIWDQTQLMEILKGTQTKAGPNPISSTIFGMTMRARFNTQRQYEIYAIDCDESFTEDRWDQMWKDDPQFCADIIREKGIKIHSDRTTRNQKVF